jgi:hypothetical protein
MPGFIALKLCPELIIVKPNFHKYKEASSVFHKIFAEYDPNFIVSDFFYILNVNNISLILLMKHH